MFRMGHTAMNIQCIDRIMSLVYTMLQTACKTRIIAYCVTRDGMIKAVFCCISRRWHHRRFIVSYYVSHRENKPLEN
eukprot:scaffold311040_cov16-Prasinocladus_malaysianus.AAC.1